MEIKKVAVIGAGAMGTGIAYVCATKGYQVYIRDINEDLVKRGMGKIRSLIATGVDRGKMTPKQAEETLKRIKGTTDIGEAVKDADLVIEAVFEDMDLKKKVFKELDKASPPHTILASNTSTLSITEMGTATKRPDKVVGLHFFNPAYTMKLVEIIWGEKTSEETTKTLTDFAISLDKEPVQVKKDIRGFIVNRILGAAMGEAIYLFEEGIASADDIDKAVVLGLNWPMGPLKLADFVGLDVVYHSSKSTAAEMNEEYIRKRFQPSKLLEKMVKEGRLGMKTRKGFYEY
jgi:3-hydroxyacyl-CoA dehydrogenase